MCVRRITADVYVVHALCEDPVVTEVNETVVVVCDDIKDHRIHRSRRFYGCSIGVYGRYCPRAQSSDELTGSMPEFSTQKVGTFTLASSQERKSVACLGGQVRPLAVAATGPAVVLENWTSCAEEERLFIRIHFDIVDKFMRCRAVPQRLV